MIPEIYYNKNIGWGFHRNVNKDKLYECRSLFINIHRAKQIKK